jgi:vacuolar-type H+-ATPase catalytic subunit A/Vma1
MRDTLKQRLFDLGYGTGSKTPSEAITYIEELELELYEMNVLYGSVKDGLEEKLAEALAVAKIWQEDFIQENNRWGDAEAKLAKAVEAIREMMQDADYPNDVWKTGEAVLAELEGKNE